jgi:hypothetical protein
MMQHAAGVSPRNCLAAPAPAISSRTAGRNMRPGDDLQLRAHLEELQPTPRRVTLASVPVSIFGTFATVTSSFDSSALPSASLASPGALLIVRRHPRASDCC